MQQRGATAAQQECASVRCCFTIASQIQNVIQNKCLPFAFLSDGLSVSSLQFLSASAQRQKSVCSEDSSAAQHWWEATTVGHGLFSRPFTVGHMVIRPYDPCSYCTTAKDFIRNITHTKQFTRSAQTICQNRYDIYSIQVQWDLVMKNKQSFVFSLLSTLCAPKSGTGIHCALQSPAWSPQKRAS